MSSWLTGLSASVGDLSNKVQAALPAEKREMLQKLTLTTPQMNAERKKMEEEEARRERVQQLLANMLPWDTRDAEREILVEECRLAILNLSQTAETFQGPYPLPPLPNTGNDEQEEEEDDEEEEAGPSPESLVKLSKLEPLPPLLAEFDLDAHVGLIQKLLKLDDMLVEQQSKLSGAGDREWTFWRNYFFHCAFTRYEAGLSIDEIWSDDPIPETVEQQQEEAEETITFDTSTDKQQEEDSGEGGDSTPLFDSPSSTRSKTTATSEGQTAGATTTTAESSTSGASSNDEGTDYEMISGGGENDGDVAELDELEAEIARELQD